ncbi:MAG: hypothetical protein FJ191_12690 [Gammaproteobacteria bacterium]|nr:hypothetical protein [Gammaproteobacteria bacterium]
MLVLTSKSRTARLVFSGDPAVELAGDRPAAAAWVPADRAVKTDGAHVVEVRALSWIEWTEAEALKPGEQIAAVVKAGLVGIEPGGAEARAAFLADPNPALVTPLYSAISALTWGN